MSVAAAMLDRVREQRRSVALRDEAMPGDLAVETTGFHVDPDAIGYVLGHGLAPYDDRAPGCQREIWDVVPLSGARGTGGLPYQRWENATFRPASLRGLRVRRLRARVRYLVAWLRWYR